MDEFEQFLSQQPFRNVPSSWRREVLSAAPVTVRPRWQEWLWPSPVAWGALAACWVAIAGLQWAARPPATGVAKQPQPVPSEIATALAEQRRLLAELIAPPVPEAPPRRITPGPRSERAITVAAA